MQAIKPKSIIIQGSATKRKTQGKSAVLKFISDGHGVLWDMGINRIGGVFILLISSLFQHIGSGDKIIYSL